MFGYVRIYKPELKVREYEAYKGIYCTLCREMGRYYGIHSRMLLNYDYTFVAMLYMALHKQEPCFEKKHCVFDPFKRCTFCSCERSAFELTGAMTALMFHYKVIDNVRDSGWVVGTAWRMLKLFSSPMRRRAKKRYSKIDEIIAQCMNSQYELERAAEKANVKDASQRGRESQARDNSQAQGGSLQDGEFYADNVSVDSAAEPTAVMLRELAQMLSEDERDKIILRDFGYYFGRWIYLIDAFDDIEKDLKKGSFNPFIIRFGLCRQDAEKQSERLVQARIYANECLNMTAARAIKSFELLDVGQYAPIFENVLYLGLGESQRRALHEKEMQQND